MVCEHQQMNKTKTKGKEMKRKIFKEMVFSKKWSRDPGFILRVLDAY